MQDRELFDRLPAIPVLVGILLAFLLQIACGTSIIFASIACIYLVVAALAFNVASGIQSVQGVVILTVAIKCLLLALVVKVALWQPVDSNLPAANRTVFIVTMGMVQVGLAAFASRAIRLPRPPFPKVDDPETLFWVGLVTVVIGFAANLSTFMIQGRSGIVAAALGGFSYIRVLAPLGLSAFLARRIILSRRERLLDLPVAITLFLELAFGFYTTSKLYIFEPIFVMILTAAAFSFKVRFKHIAWGTVLGVFGVVVVMPLVQFSRMFTRSADFSSPIEGVRFMVSEVFSSEGYYDEIRDFYDEMYEGTTPVGFYFGSSEPLLDRINMLHPAALLIQQASISNPLGIRLMLEAFSILPRALMVDGATGYERGEYVTAISRMTGLVSEVDEQTSISVTAFADAFALESWMGAAFLPGLGFLFGFILLQWAVPTLRNSIWGVALVITVYHDFSEAALGSVYHLVFRRLPIIIVAMWVSWMLAKHLLSRTNDEDHLYEARPSK